MCENDKQFWESLENEKLMEDVKLMGNEKLMEDVKLMGNEKLMEDVKLMGNEKLMEDVKLMGNEKLMVGEKLMAGEKFMENVKLVGSEKALENYRKQNEEILERIRRKLNKSTTCFMFELQVSRGKFCPAIYINFRYEFIYWCEIENSIRKTENTTLKTENTTRGTYIVIPKSLAYKSSKLVKRLDEQIPIHQMKIEDVREEDVENIGTNCILNSDLRKVIVNYLMSITYGLAFTFSCIKDVYDSIIPDVIPFPHSTYMSTIIYRHMILNHEKNKLWLIHLFDDIIQKEKLINRVNIIRAKVGDENKSTSYPRLFNLAGLPTMPIDVSIFFDDDTMFEKLLSAATTTAADITAAGVTATATDFTTAGVTAVDVTAADVNKFREIKANEEILKNVLTRLMDCLPAKNFVIYRLIENGYLPGKVEYICVPPEKALDMVDDVISRAVSDFKESKINIMLSLKFMPSDLQKIIYGYINWWYNIDKMILHMKIHPNDYDAIGYKANKFRFINLYA